MAGKSYFSQILKNYWIFQIVELRRNPTGAVDKKTRATLRPMSKNGRRDSSMCELEQQMRDVRSNNNRFKKLLNEKERELQALIAKMGPEARKWIENNPEETEPLTGAGASSDPSNNKLAVPGSRHDLSSVGKNLLQQTTLPACQNTFQNNNLTANNNNKLVVVSAVSDLPTEISCIDTTDMTSVGSSRDDMERTSGQKTPDQK